MVSYSQILTLLASYLFTSELPNLLVGSPKEMPLIQSYYNIILIFIWKKATRINSEAFLFIVQQSVCWVSWALTKIWEFFYSLDLTFASVLVVNSWSIRAVKNCLYFLLVSVIGTVSLSEMNHSPDWGSPVFVVKALAGLNDHHPESSERALEGRWKRGPGEGKEAGDWPKSVSDTSWNFKAAHCMNLVVCNFPPKSHTGVHSHWRWLVVSVGWK